MNEIIKELLEQAGFELHYESDGTFSHSQQFEKFAELIMQECAKACEDDACNTLESPMELINQHFGIDNV